MELGLFAVRCHFNPTIPFRFASQEAHAPQELATLIDRDGQSFERGIRLLTTGWIRTWLICTGRMRNPSAFDEIVADETISPGRKMEAVLHLLDPALPWPRPAADVPSIDPGAISAESSRSVRLTISNAGRGFLSGIITLGATDTDKGLQPLVKPLVQGAHMSMKTTIIEGGPTTVEVVLHGRGLPVGAEEHGVIVATTNGGVIEIPVLFRVTAPLRAMLLRSLGVGAIAGSLLGAFRYAVQLVMPQYATQLIQAIPYGRISNEHDVWMLIPFAVGFLTTVGGLLYYAGRLYYVREFRKPCDGECR
jgi:hypothetical protein